MAAEADPMRRVLVRFAAPVLALSLALAGPVRAADPQPGTPDGTAVLQGYLKSLYVSEGLSAEQVVLFPLYVLAEPAPLAVTPVVDSTPLRVDEPAEKPGKEWVKVSNPGPKPVLLVAGTVLEGGKRDRVIRNDRFIGPADAATVEVLPGSMSSDIRKEPKDFRVQDFLAPNYVRQAIQFSTSKGLVPRFVSHFLDFRNAGDVRKSLTAIGDSDALANYCLVCQRSFSEWPAKKGAGTVVGGIAVVRGRAQSLEAFATNGMLQDFFGPVLKALSFPAAAIELRAKKVGIPLPGKDDPKALETGTKVAKELLTQLVNATIEKRKLPDGALGEAFTLKLKDGSRGVANLLDGRLVHLAIYVDDPFEDNLYASELEPLDPEDASGDPTDDVGRAELERRAASGARLTPAEQRLLDRMRHRSGIR
jgi:hypothetical protein